MGRPLLRVLLRAGGFSDPAAFQQHFDEAFCTVERDVTALQAAVPRTHPFGESADASNSLPREYSG